MIFCSMFQVFQLLSLNALKNKKIVINRNTWNTWNTWNKITQYEGALLPETTNNIGKYRIKNQ